MNGVKAAAGVSGALWGALLPALAAYLWLPTTVCRGWACKEGILGAMPEGLFTREGEMSVSFSPRFAPYIDNPPVGRPGGERVERHRCPGTGDPPFLTLATAPLPAAFDPGRWTGRPLYACVLTSAKGKVLAARLLDTTGGTAMDRAIIAQIRERWRFEPQSEESEGRGWQRVNLNAAREQDFMVY
jgi:hypothetical protein